MIHIISGTILGLASALWLSWFIWRSQKLYWFVGGIKYANKPKPFKPTKELKRLLKGTKYNIVVKAGNTYYAINCHKQMHKADLVCLIDTSGDIHITRCMTYDKLGIFPPVFRDSSTLVDHDVVGVVIKVIGSNSEEQVIEELNL